MTPHYLSIPASLHIVDHLLLTVLCSLCVTPDLKTIESVWDYAKLSGLLVFNTVEGYINDSIHNSTILNTIYLLLYANKRRVSSNYLSFYECNANYD